MNIKSFINQYGLMIFEIKKSYLIMFNGNCLKLKNRKIDLNKIDSILFYKLANKQD